MACAVVGVAEAPAPEEHRAASAEDVKERGAVQVEVLIETQADQAGIVPV